MHGFLSALDRHLDLHSRGYDWTLKLPRFVDKIFCVLVLD